MDAKTTKRTPVVAVSGLIVDAMSKAGLPAGDAAKVAELMLEADLTGADAHGVFRLPQYVDAAQAQARSIAHPNIKVTRSAPATALVDGDNGMGHLVVARAAETAIELARETGVAWVGVRMSNHAGAAGVYAALPLKADMIGMYSAVANANHMPLAGGAEPLLGTNPLAIAIPAGAGAAAGARHRDLDRVLRHHQEPPPAGHAVAAGLDGRSEDRRGGHRCRAKAPRRCCCRWRGYKGAGLALMFGLLAGTLNGALFGRDCIDFNAEPDAVTNTGQFVVALDPARFQPIEQFKAEVDRHSRELRASAALPGESVRLPGEQRAQRRADRLANGLALPAELHVELDKLAAELAIKPLAAR